MTQAGIQTYKDLFAGLTDSFYKDNSQMTAVHIANIVNLMIQWHNDYSKIHNVEKFIDEIYYHLYQAVPQSHFYKLIRNPATFEEHVRAVY